MTLREIALDAMRAVYTSVSKRKLSAEWTCLLLGHHFGKIRYRNSTASYCFRCKKIIEC